MKINIKRLFNLIAILIIISAPFVWQKENSSYAVQQKSSSYELNAPKDWRSETINFPLDFAPEIKYQGYEELRFSPGMFKRESDTYFSYIFFWNLKGNEKISPEILEHNLTLYFKGLCKAVGESRKIDIDLNKIATKVTTQELNSNDKKRYKALYNASITTFDPFNKGEEIKLNAEIVLLNASNKDQTILFFSVSTKPSTDAIWKQMLEIRDSFNIKF